MLDVLEGFVSIFAGAAVKSSCRKPDTSPTALIKCAPVGGLTKSRIDISSIPCAITEILIFLLSSQSVRLFVP
ncbi:hypothetical protein D3C78_1007940 [compost metagenome]